MQRDLIALEAMKVILATGGFPTAQEIAARAYELADAMLAVREATRAKATEE